jgi:itaconyl-CoA hydratase
MANRPPSPAFSAYVELEPRRFRERFGLVFEQFRAGQRFEHRPGLTLSQQDNRDECLDTLNQQMLHFDERFAARTAWGRCLMDSTLTTKLVMGMTWKTFAQRTGLVGLDEIALNAPVFGGDTIYAESEILACEDNGDDATTGRVSVRTRGLNQQNVAVITLVQTIDVARRSDEAAEGTGVPERHHSHVEIAPGVFRERMGLFFEDVAVGDTYEHRPGRRFSIEESGRDTLRALDHTGALTPWHVTPSWAETTINPLHVLAVVTGMQTKTFSRIVANLAWQDVRFPEPVRDGETVHAETTVVDARRSESRSGQGIIHLRTVATGADQRPVCRFDRKVLIYMRGEGPYTEAGY